MKIRLSKTIYCILLTLLMGCTSNKTPDYKTANIIGAKQLQGIFEELIPVGTSISNAQAIMEEEGFVCEVRNNKTLKYWVKDADGTGVLKKIANSDFLYCKRMDKRGFWVSCTLTVQILYDDDETKRIYAAVSCVGP